MHQKQPIARNTHQYVLKNALNLTIRQYRANQENSPSVGLVNKEERFKMLRNTL
jgi:hypothetical protein